MRNEFDAFLTAQRGRFALFVPVFVGGGILAYFARATEPSPVWSWACAVLAAGLAAAVWRWAVARAVGVGLACAATGWALACAATARAPPWPDLPRHAVVLGGVVSLVEALPEGRRITLDTPSLDGDPPLARAVRVRLRATDVAPVSAGDRVAVRALLRAPPPPDYPGGWDTQREAFFSGLGGYGFAIGAVQIERAAGAGPWRRLREHVAGRIMAGLPGPPGAIAATLLTGLGTAIPPGDRAAFQDSGLAHLLAVAGLHIGIVMGLVFAGVRLGLAAIEYTALHWPTRQLAALAALAAGGLYLALTGAHLPILRSFAMAALVTLGVLTGRRAVSLRGLCVAALLLMLAWPASVMSVGFQMSFATVLMLIAGAELARPAMARLGQGAWWRRPALYVAGLVLTSALAGTAALPFAAYHFGRATLYYVPANLLAVPLTAFWVMPCGLAALALMPLGLERLALAPMGWGLRGLLAIADDVAAWPDASVPVPQMPGAGLVLVAAGLAWAGLWRGRLRLAGLLPLALGLAAPWAARPPDILVGPEARVIALRVAGRVLVERAPGTSAFEAEAPGRVWGEPVAQAPDGQSGVACTRQACRATLSGARVLLVREAAGLDCTALVVLSAASLHGACPDATTIDRAATLRDGAIAVRLSAAAPVVTTDRAWRGARPWVLLPPPLLPMARAE